MENDAPVRLRVRRHPPLALGCDSDKFLPQGAGVVEQLLRPVAPQPFLELGTVLVVRPHVGERHLVRSPRSLHRHAVHFARTGPALRRPEDDHRAPVVEGAVEQLGEAAVDREDVLVVETRGEDEWRVPVAAHERDELVLGNAREDGRVRDLVAVEVEDRQDAAV